MFQKICIKPNKGTFPTDIGLLAENLLYYNKVILVAGTDTLPTLLRHCDVDTIVEILKRGNLEIRVQENLLGTMQREISGKIIHDVALWSSKNLNTEEVVFRGLFEVSGRRGYSRRNTNKLLNYIVPIKYDEQITNFINQDLEDEKFVKQAMIDILQIRNPDLNIPFDSFYCKRTMTPNGFYLESNLDFDLINRHLPNNSDGQLFRPTGIILNIQETRGDMHLAATLGAEISTTPIHTQLMKRKFQDIYRKSTKSFEDLQQFNDFILDNGHAIKEAINSGERNLKDFLPILEKADKFREWIHQVGDDKNLIKEYHKAVVKETWVDKLPAKSVRFSLFTGAGLTLDLLGAGGVGTAINTVLGAGDTFLLDKVLKGWKPNVFVDRDLKKFINNPKK